jgi:arabinofuranan 3-O-arabinosyltransferase
MSMPADSMARQVRVTTERGSATTSVSGTGQQPLNVVAGQTRFLQVTVTAVRGPGPFHQVGITDVRIPGLSVERTVVMPSNAPAAGAVQQVLMSAPDDARNGCVVQAADVRCAVGQAQLGEETAGIDRTFSLPAAGRFAVGLTAVPRAGPQLDALIASVLGSDVSVSSSSRAIADPLAGPASVLDADRGTGWIASTSDPAPTVTIRWGRPLTMSSLVIKTASTLAATAPDTVVVTTPGGSRTARIGPDGTVSFAAVRTDRVSMVLTSSTGLRLDYDPVTHGYDHLGIGVSEIDVPGVATPARAATDATPVALPCGSGPDVVVDGVTRQTLVDATLADLRDLRRVAMTVCGGDQMPLSAGPHRVRAVSTSTWIPLRLSLAASAPAAPPAPVPTTVRHWGATDRSVGVGVRAGETLVVVDENANAGWHATFAGHRLQAITVDGWEQGFLLPAGAAGVMHLEYVPDRIYRLALLAGLLAVMLLVIGAFRGPRRIPRRAATLPPSAGWPGRVGLLTASLGFALLTAGWRGGAVWLVVGSAAVLNERGSWHRRRYLMPFLAGAAYLTAGLTLAVGHWGTTHYAATSSFVQLMTAAAVVATAWAPGPAGVSPPRAGDDRIAHPPDAATSSPDVPRIGT